MNQGDLVKRLMQEGFTRSNAMQCVQTTLDVIKLALRDHESVELPFGTLEVRECPPTQRHWRLGKIVVQYRKRYRVRLTSREL
jgi:nucleoid DNA-binding protein